MSSHHSQPEEQVASYPGVGPVTYVLCHSGQPWLERADGLTNPGPRMHRLHRLLCLSTLIKITKYCPPPHSFCTKSPLRQISKQGKGTYNTRVGSETRRKGTFLSGGCVAHLTLNKMSSQRPNENTMSAGSYYCKGYHYSHFKREIYKRNLNFRFNFVTSFNIHNLHTEAVPVPLNIYRTGFFLHIFYNIHTYAFFWLKQQQIFIVQKLRNRENV